VTSLELTYSPYSISLTKPFITSRGEISERKGFIISVKNQSNEEGIGEAAPLPEFGSESYEDDEKALENIQLNLRLDLNNLPISIDESLSDFNHLPALRSGIEQAILNLICVEKKTTLGDLFNVVVARNISVNGIIGLLDNQTAVAMAKELKAAGYRSIKIKVGRSSFEDDLEIVKNIRGETGKNIMMRLDANGKWDTNEAVNCLKQLEQFNIEYIEQPVSNIENFIGISENTSIPLAADESLRSYKEATDIINNNLAPVLILKPMMLGGLTTTMKIINQAEKKGLKIVITSSIETSIGRSIAVFAAGILKKQTAHGLAVADYFRNTIVYDPFPVNNGMIKIG
jgi:o-succinylbenzoate synthase